jgi:hypothetical protein
MHTVSASKVSFAIEFLNPPGLDTHFASKQDDRVGQVGLAWEAGLTGGEELTR